MSSMFDVYEHPEKEYKKKVYNPDATYYLFRAIKQNDVLFLKSLLNSTADYTYYINENDQSIFQYAMTLGNSEIIDMIMKSPCYKIHVDDHILAEKHKINIPFYIEKKPYEHKDISFVDVYRQFKYIEKE